MYFFNLCQQILRDMWARKLRSCLALFGIIWGTVTVVLLLSLGTGFESASRKNMMQLVDGTLFVIPAQTSKSYRGFPKGQKVNIKSSAVMALQRNVPGIDKVSPMLIQRIPLRYKDKQRSKEIYGVSDSLGVLQKINIEPEGRFLNKLDIQNNAYTVVIGDQVKTQLFGNKPALGEQIAIKNINFTVVGVIQKARKNVYNLYRNKAIIPYTTDIKLFGNTTSYYFIVLPNPKADNIEVKASMRAFLAHKYHFDKTDKIALNIFDTTKMFQFMYWFFVGVQIFLGICGGLTLGVGGLGVANIMFLIVSERTREIGLRLATGAQDWHILWQVILEALVIVGVGGLIGFLFSYIVVAILQYVGLPDWLGNPTISVAGVVATLVILAVLGLLAGFFPARRAAKLDPVEALGY